MMALLRAEFRKLLTVRSTYVISIIALLLVGFLAFYVAGYKGIGGSGALWLMDMLGQVSTTVAIFVALVAILLMGHEYRYNTIMYTLTTANSRTKVLLAKVVTVVTYSLAMLVGAVILSVLAYWLGMMFAPVTRVLVTPELFWGDVWHATYFVVGYGLLGLLFAFIFRHLVGAIAALFIIPTVEGILSLILKDNVKYLPMTSLEQVHSHDLLSSGRAALVFAGYMAVIWLVTWYVFQRRDAN